MKIPEPDAWTDYRRAGLYHFTGNLAALRQSAANVGIAVFEIDCAGAENKTGLLQTFADALKFPGYYGGNWDALHDCLTDLGWLPSSGCLLIINGCAEFATERLEEFETLLEILGDTADYWRDERKAFWALLLGAEEFAPHVPALE